MDMDDIVNDLDEVFSFNPDATYQDRAHRYLNKYRVERSFNDTAVQCVVRHLIGRTVEACSGCGMRERMVEEATRLLELARDIDAATAHLADSL